MEKETTRNVKLGFFVVAGAILLIVGLYFIGNNKNMFGHTFKLYANFTNVNGLQTGNNVRFEGINIGTVQKIEVINDTLIRVEMNINAEMKKMIRKNSMTSIGTDGLMGNKLINIQHGDPDVPVVSDNDELRSVQSVDTDDMLRTLEYTNKNVSIISANLKNITDNINRSRGTLYTVLMDTSLAGKLTNTLNNIENVSNNLSGISSDLSAMVNDMKDGKGLMGTLIKDTVMTAQLKQAISEVKSSSEKIDASASELKKTMQNINNGKGTVSTLINDTVTANHLKQSIVDIEKSAHSFNENMEALKHSFLLRGYFKKQESKNK